MHLPTLQVADERADHAAQVKAGIVIEAAIFVGDGRLAAVFRNLIERYPLSIARALVDDFVQQVLAGPIVNLGRFEEVLILIGELRFDLAGIRQIGGEAQVCGDCSADRQRKEQPAADQCGNECNPGDADKRAAFALPGALPLVAIEDDVNVGIVAQE